MRTKMVLARYLTFVVGTLVSFLVYTGPAQAALVNWGFEAGSLDGWSTFGTVTPAVSAYDGLAKPDAGAGNYYVQLTADGASSGVRQTIQLDNSQSFRFWYQVAKADEMDDKLLIFLNADGSTYDQKHEVTGNTTGWATWTTQPLTAGIDYTITIGAYGIDAFVDTAVVPIPPAVWLLGSGLVGLIGLRRRFKK